MSIIGTLPITLVNGTTADATQVMSNFNYIVSQANANAAHSGANSDITSITGLSTPLAVGQGGSGATSGPTALQNLNFVAAAGPTFITGFTLSNNAGTPNTKLDVTGGAACATTGGTGLLYVTAASTTIDLSGTGPNGLDTGALANNTWYHVYIIGNAAGSSQAFIGSTNASAPAYPATYTQARRIGSFRTDGSAHILPFKQLGDRFEWTTPFTDANNVAPADTNAHSQTLTVPTGVQVTALFTSQLVRGANDTTIWYSSLTETDTAAGAGYSSLVAIGVNNSSGGQFQVRTSTAAAIRYRSVTTGCTFYIITEGWIDIRGAT